MLPTTPNHFPTAAHRQAKSARARRLGGMQRGFTLIELIVVIIILGILAAVAVPKFIDMSIEAHNAAAKGVAGALASSSTINYAARVVNPASGVAISSPTSCDASLLSPLLTGTTSSLSSSAPLDDQTFQIAPSFIPQDCSGSAVTIVCFVTPRGNGVTAVPVTILCAR